MRTLKCSLKDIHKCKVPCQYTRKFLHFWECPDYGNEFARPLLAEMTKTPKKERKKEKLRMSWITKFQTFRNKRIIKLFSRNDKDPKEKMEIKTENFLHHKTRF